MWNPDLSSVTRVYKYGSGGDDDLWVWWEVDADTKHLKLKLYHQEFPEMHYRSVSNSRRPADAPPKFPFPSSFSIVVHSVSQGKTSCFSSGKLAPHLVILSPIGYTLTYSYSYSIADRYGILCRNLPTQYNGF